VSVKPWLAGLAFAAGAFATPTASGSADNPFFDEWKTPFGVPPFDAIRTEHYMPAIREGVTRHTQEVEAIAANPAPATFANTVEALERSGAFLTRASNVFDVLNESMTDDAMQAVAAEKAPLLSGHRDDILLNEKLFARIRTVWENRAGANLAPEQARLLERTYKDFVRGGAALDADKKAQLRKVNEELALLTLKYGNNVLAETNGFKLVIDSEADLAGLPPMVVAAAAEAAKARDLPGKWVFTPHKPSLIPFLEYSTRRDLREKMFRSYTERGNYDNEFDNKAIASRLAALRVTRANLLGFPSHAAFVLDDAMAKTPERVLDFLNRLWTPALEVSKQEAAQYQAMLWKDVPQAKLEPWDWFYYARQVRKEKYALDDEELRPYFKLENVIDGAFGVATKLWGIRFVDRPNLPKYHPDVRVFEVTEKDGQTIGILYVDYFPRESKRGGAWMNNLREQSIAKGTRIVPVITNNGNFTKPAAGKPSLLSLEEVGTLFHEFGHALHGLLSNCTYERLAGTNVATDFVELPSQIMENWATDPEVLPTYAKHFETGKPIPAELVQRIKNAELFNQGFATVEYLAASLLDLDYHLLTEAKGPRVPAFEAASMHKIHLIDEIVPRYRSTYFNHIFSGGYAAGYYAYIWSEVLDCDAYEAFKEKGIFDRATALSFRRNILEPFGTEDPMAQYVRFRGAEPKIEPLLRKRGLDAER
jgi:peptidyl-dipeptidase Dcp